MCDKLTSFLKYVFNKNKLRVLSNFICKNIDNIGFFFTTECPSMPNLVHPLSSDIACYIPDHCTAVDCCVYVELLDRSFHVYLDIDSCYYRLTVGVERMNYTLNLIDYKWGMFELHHSLIIFFQTASNNIENFKGYSFIQFSNTFLFSLKIDIKPFPIYIYNV